MTWLSCDSFFAKAPVRGGTGTGPNPTDRAKQGVKRSLLVDQCGGPISTIVAPANVHDSKLLKPTLDASLLSLCTGTRNRTSHLCLDKGYDTPAVRDICEQHRVTAHIRRIGEESRKLRGHPTKTPRRWVAERTGAWYNQCRGLATRHERKAENYEGLCHLRNALIWCSRIGAEIGW
jgi:transposase